MRVLLTGANGFIGRYLLAALLRAGHAVVPAVRRPGETDRLLAKPASNRVDFNRDLAPGDWLPRLAGIDAVINCAGILQGHSDQSIAAIHAEAPQALFRACELAGVRRVIQISAISADADTPYAVTKKSADDFLAATDLDWVILRPSLVYARGAAGGTALLRALAALPFVIPVVGNGSQAFQPIDIDDLSQTILTILTDPKINRAIIDPVGPDVLTLRQILIDLRRWLGFAPAKVLNVPLVLIGIAARLGDFLGGTINTTALRQLQHGNAGDVSAFTAATGIVPRRWSEALLANPAQVQDRWHARLYFARPLLRLTIAVTWIGSGLAGLIGRAALPGLLASMGLAIAPPLIWATCLLDIAIGGAVFFRWRTPLMAIVQIVVVAAYTAILTWAAPSLWLEPFGPLLKNIPFCAAVLALAAMERER